MSSTYHAEQVKDLLQASEIIALNIAILFMVFAVLQARRPADIWVANGKALLWLLFTMFLLAGGADAKYALTTDLSGANFFEGFTFFTGPDPTNGHVVFVDEETANATALAGFLPNIVSNGNSTITAAGPVYLGVDHTNVTPQGRPSVRLQSVQTFNHALVIADIAHMPGGPCGVWPAFWLLGTSHPWPEAGEIDVVEGVNTQAFNRMTLHTNAGMSIDNSSINTDIFTGNLVTADCDVNDPNQDKNAGCQIADQPNLLSFGTGFNQQGGGVFAMEWTSDAIKIWFFPRSQISSWPADLLTDSPNPSGSSSNSTNVAWPTPNAVFQSPTPGTIDAHFCALQLVFDTTFCGDWAGAPSVWNSDPTCAPLADTCEDYVTNTPEAFTEAYWVVEGLKVFQDDQDPFRVGGGATDPDGGQGGNGTVSRRWVRTRRGF